MLLYGSGSRRDEEFSRAVRRVTAGMAQAIAPLIAADIDEEHRLTLAHALVGLAEGASRRLVERGDDFDPDVLARQISDLAWAGLRGVHRAMMASVDSRLARLGCLAGPRPQRAGRSGRAWPASGRGASRSETPPSERSLGASEALESGQRCGR